MFRYVLRCRNFHTGNLLNIIFMFVCHGPFCTSYIPIYYASKYGNDIVVERYMEIYTTAGSVVNCSTA